MVGRLMRQILLLLASLAIASSGVAAQPKPDRIVAVGDLHGDWQAWIAIARAAGLVDARNRWAGGRTTFVQLGDIADRGPDSRKIIAHLRQLQRSAPRSGGNVIVLAGNHEAMNVIGDLRYVHPGEYAAFADRRSKSRRDSFFERNRAKIEALYRSKDPNISDAALRQAYEQATPLGMIEHQAAWQPSGEIGRWVVSSPAVVKVGASLFVHGGLAAENANLSIEEINRRVAAALEARDQSLNSIVSGPLSPLWYRGHIARGGSVGEEIALAASANGPASERQSIEQELDTVLGAFGARRIIVGHTPRLEGIAVDHGGKLVRIDTGISNYYGGRLSYLEIIGDRLIPHHVERPQAGGGAGI